MPTENLSSNTEMVSVPPYIGLEPLVGRYYPAKCRRCGWVGSSEELTEDDAQCTRHIGDRLCLGDCDELERDDLLGIIQAMAAPQPHPEPIAWMVGTAFWWTKEEAERDAAATGLPIVGLGPMIGIAPAEQIQVEPALWRYRKTPARSWFYTAHKRSAEIALRDGYIVEEFYTRADPDEADDLLASTSLEFGERLDAVEKERDTMRAQLAERDALLREADEFMYIMTGHDSHARLAHKYGEKWWDAIDKLRGKVCTALSANAEPSEPTAKSGGSHG